MEAQMEQMRMQLEGQKLEFEKYKADLDNQTRVVVAEINAKTDLHLKSLDINAAHQEGLTEVTVDGMEQPTSALSSLVEAINNNMATMVAVQAQHNTDLLTQQQMAHQNLVQQLTKPKQVVRDASGKIQGVV
jgi:hypothetical protein